MAQTITVETRDKDAVVDITDEVAHYLRGQERDERVCLAFAAHTTCALTTAEPQSRDRPQSAGGAAPPAAADVVCAAHTIPRTRRIILASLIGPSVAAPFQGKRLLLGTWQHIVLVEFDGPRQRTVHLAVM